MIVIDTHVLIWMTGEKARLSRRAASALEREPEICVPAMCCWEYATLATRQRFRLTRELAAALDSIFQTPGMRLQPITPSIAIRAARLALTQSLDPADQLIAATAIELGLPLVTADERLQSLPGLRTIW